MGGIEHPAALMQARVVICCLLLKEKEYTVLALLGARILPLVCCSGKPASSPLHTLLGLFRRPCWVKNSLYPANHSSSTSLVQPFAQFRGKRPACLELMVLWRLRNERTYCMQTCWLMHLALSVKCTYPLSPRHIICEWIRLVVLSNYFLDCDF